MKRVGLLGVVLLLMLPAACWAQVATQPAVPALSEVERLKREVAELKKTVDTLRTENEKLKKQWNDAVRDGTGGSSTPSATPTTPATPLGGTPATMPATTNSSKIEQDGPGTYRVSAGPKGRFTTTLHAKSREDAITLALKTVGKTAMAFDENADINELKIERLGP